MKILSRQEWSAKEPVAKMTPHEPKFITIHHTAVKQNPKKALKDKLKSLQEFSQRASTLANGKPKPVWPDVPYHFYIGENGEVAEGRSLWFVGDTNTEYDPTGHILVTLEGNFEEEEPTPAQLKSTEQLVSWLAQKYQVPLTKIKGHKDYAQTLCPGEKLYQRLADLQASVKQSTPATGSGQTKP
jgi:N-acetyl-anhydromuramyl-L-alanine amidase AmpD